jgi:hypothetical protein
MTLSIHLAQVESYKQNLPPWDDEAFWELADQKTDELATLTGSEFTQVWDSFQAWSSDLKWEDEQFVRLFLTNRLARVGLPEELGDEPPISLEEWEERCRTAGAEVDAMSTAERVTRAKELQVEQDVALDAGAIEALLKDGFQTAAAEGAREEIVWTELFVNHPIDIIFILLALVSAFKLASGGGED